MRLMRAVYGSGVLFTENCRVTGNRCHENGESGDYSQNTFSVRSLSNFLVQPGI